MSDLGPAWLRRELPQPIAAAWNVALLHYPISGSAAAVAVEAALRFVCALQAASLLAESRPLPAIFRRKFDRPTLGSWCTAVEDLRREARRPFVPALATWPDAGTLQGLRDFTRLRNDLSHDQLTPLARRELDNELGVRAADLLATLGWLRGLDIVIVAEQQHVTRDEMQGRLQRFQSDAPHPPLERARWRGRVEVGRTYVSNGTHALDLEPFVRRARIGNAKNEALCLWSGVGEKRGDIRLRDDSMDTEDWVPLVSERRPVPFVRLTLQPAATDVTRPDAPSLVTEPPTLVAAHPKPERAQKRGHTPWLALWLGAGALVLAGVVGVAVSKGSPRSATKATSPHVEPATAPACPVPGIGGAWTFDTYVLRAKVGMEYGLNVRGHYELKVDAAIDCTLPFLLTKTGYTQGANENTDRFSNRARMKVSASGRSASVEVKLHRAGVRSNHKTLRLSRAGDLLVGMWRDEGEDWEWGGYSGAILGTKPGAPLRDEINPQCFLDCIHDCHPGLDPTDEATESCVTNCARRLETCR